MRTKTPETELARQLKTALEAKREAAQESWQAFETERRAIVEAGIDLTQDAKRLAALDERHKTYEGIAAEARDLESRLFARMTGSPVPGQPAGLKALATGQVVPGHFTSGIFSTPSRAIFALSRIPIEQADGDTIFYVKQTVQTMNAAAVAPGAVKPTSVLTVARVEERIRTIATLSELLDRNLIADFDEIPEWLEEQLAIAVLTKVEDLVISGDGAGENLRGILNTVGIGTVAKGGAEPALDALYRAVTTTRLANIEPTTVVIHPSKFSEIRLAKDANGSYTVGAPSPGEDPDRLWHLDVVASSAMPVGTAIVGDFEGARLWLREEMRVDWSDSDGTAFQTNSLRARAECRLAFGVPLPASFTAVTAL